MVGGPIISYLVIIQYDSNQTWSGSGSVWARAQVSKQGKRDEMKRKPITIIIIANNNK